MGFRDSDVPLNHLARMGIGITAVLLVLELASGFSLSGFVNGLLCGALYLGLLGLALAATDRALYRYWAGGLAGAAVAALWSKVQHSDVLLTPIAVGLVLGVIAPVWELQER